MIKIIYTEQDEEQVKKVYNILMFHFDFDETKVKEVIKNNAILEANKTKFKSDFDNKIKALNIKVK